MPADIIEESSRRCQEVEVKYRVADLDGLVTALSARGVTLSAPVDQDDQAYAPSWWAYGQPKTGVPFARLRRQATGHVFTVKVPQANELACAEHETAVVDRDQMHAAILAMGFRPTMRIVKRRRTAAIDDLCLCVDVVDGLGVFLEVERIVAAGESGVAVQVALDLVVRSLGVSVERVHDTYDSLLRARDASAVE